MSASDDSPQPTAHDQHPAEIQDLLETDASRRTILRGLGAAGTATAVGSAGIGSTGAIDMVEPETVAKAAAVTYVAAGAGATIAAWEYATGDDGDGIDEDDVLEDQIYQTTTSVADGREAFVDEMETQFLAPDDPQNTPYGRSAWQTIRAEAVREIVNGGSEADARSAAIDGLDLQTTRSLVNVLERAATGVNGLIEEYVIDYEEGVGVHEWDDGDYSREISPHSDHSDMESVDASEVGDGNYLAFKKDISDVCPVDPTELDGRDDPLEIYLFAAERSSGNERIIRYVSSSVFSPEMTSDGGYVLVATHSDFGDTVVLDGDLFSSIVSVIRDAHSSIRSDVETYVGNLYQGVQQGAIDPSDVLSSQDIIDEFADSSEQSRLAAELMAVGAHVPGEAGYQATISHPDLQADELTGMLYPQFEGEPIDVSAGMTIAPEDYSMAYFGYEAEFGDEDDPFETMTLSGEEPLEVLDVDGVEGQTEIDVDDDETAGENGRVSLGDADLPDEGTIVIEDGDGNRYTVDLEDVQSDETGEQYIEVPEIESGTDVERVKATPDVEYERTVEYVADPTDVDSEETLARLEAQREQIEELKEALDDDDGLLGGIGGWGGGDGVGQNLWVGLGFIVIVLVIVAGVLTDAIDSFLG
ncbi:twin-arginine translocation signal domain-containing protein [Natrialbaceae archaeon A-arb3/5]